MEGQISPPEYLEPVPKPKRKAKLVVAVVIAIVVIIILSVIGLQSTNVIHFGSVTMREIQNDFVDAERGFKHYNSGDTVVLVDTIVDVELHQWLRDYTAIKFDIDQLPAPDDVAEGRVQSKPWFTYYPTHHETATGFYGMGEMHVNGDLTDKLHVGSKVKLTLHFKATEMAGHSWQPPYIDGPYNLEYIVESGPFGYIVPSDQIEIVG